MGDPKAFLTVSRQEAGYRPIHERITDFGEVEQTLNSHDRKRQASRCMDCGVPFCHWACPVGNKQPEWQEAVYKGKWKEAYDILSSTCDFPEFTGRVCPALCEKSCVLKLSCNEPVTIRENEAAIVEVAFKEGYIQPCKPNYNGQTVAVVGAGPAGLTIANQLNRRGYQVTVFDKAEAPGGLLRFGIPNFKLNKNIIDRRIKLLETEGIKFEMNTCVDLTAMPKGFDAYCICTGAEIPRDLSVPGRDLKGIYFALDLLSQQNRILEGQSFSKNELVSAKGKKVLVIGGGDTGSDCVGTSIRQGALSVTQIEILPQPPINHNENTPWPQYPMVLKTTSSHEEGCIRRWNLASQLFVGENGILKGVEVEEVEWKSTSTDERPTMVLTGKKETIEADLVLLSMGYLKAELPTFKENVFIAGDAAMGASLVVRAIEEGRQKASAIDHYLKSLKRMNKE